MPTLESIPLLLAAGRRSGFGSSSFRSTDDPNLTGFVIVLTVLLVLGGLATLGLVIAQHLKNRPVNSSSKLFKELCRAHQLSRSDRRLLVQIAEWWEIDDPVQLFFERERWRSPSMHESLDCEALAQSLERKLFV